MEATLQQQQQQQQQLHPFLQDMQRVLHSRRDAIRNDPVFFRGMMERRTKPPIIANDIDGAERCLVLLRHLQQHHSNLLFQQQEVETNGKEDDSPTAGTVTLAEAAYQIVMRAFLRRGRLRWQCSGPTGTIPTGTVICAADQLEELLAELQDLLRNNRGDSDRTANDTCFLSLTTYNLVLQAYAICATPRGDRLYASRAHALLQEIVTLQVEPTTVADQSALMIESYLNVLHAYAWQQANLQVASTGAEPAAQLLQTICAMRPNNTNVLLRAHILVLEAYSKSVGGARQCHNLLQTVKQLNATLTDTERAAQEGRQLLDAEVYSNAILAWSKATDDSGGSGSIDDLTTSLSHSAEMAHELLLELIDLFLAGAFRNESTSGSDAVANGADISGSEPPLIAFNGVISAWGRIGRVDKAEEVLWLMEKKMRPQCSYLVPNAVSYNSVLHGILRLSDREGALRKAIELVSYMENHADEQPAIQPNAFTYHTLMKCWLQSQRPNAAEEAERLLMQIEEFWKAGDDSIEPTNRIYNMVLNSYAKKCSGRFVSVKALDLIRRMKNTIKCQPDIISYTSAIECISNSGDAMAPELAEELFSEATQLYNKTKSPDLMPNWRFYTMTIQALAKNNGSVVRARALLTQLVELYHASGQNPQLRPNTFPYNYVLNCAANTLDHKMEAFRIASQTYQEMRKSDFIRPDSYSFAFWLKCCNNLLEPGDLRTKGVSFAFEECKREGLVNNEVITRLVQGSPVSLVDELLETAMTSKTGGVTRIPAKSSNSGNSYAKDADRKMLVRGGNSLLGNEETSAPNKANVPKNNRSFRTLTVRDLPPSWSRNTRAR
jgi:hypothetical protein